MNTPVTQHRDISVHCHGRLPDGVGDVVHLPPGVRVVMMNAGGTLCGGGVNAPKFDGICVPPETFDPRFRDWMRSEPPDAATSLRNFAELMTQLRANSIDRWCVLEGTVPNLRLYCDDRRSMTPFGAYSHPFAVDVEYTDLDGATRVASVGAPEAIAALQYPLDDDDYGHVDALEMALGRVDIGLMVAFVEGRVKRIAPSRPNSFRPTPRTPNLAALLAELGLNAEHRGEGHDRHNTVNIYLFVCAGASRSAAGPAFHPSPPGSVTPLAHWLPTDRSGADRAVRRARRAYHHPYQKKPSGTEYD